eukprot:765951-Hanusia_phi.AAC.6
MQDGGWLALKNSFNTSGPDGVWWTSKELNAVREQKEEEQGEEGWGGGVRGGEDRRGEKTTR